MWAQRAQLCSRPNTERLWQTQSHLTSKRMRTSQLCEQRLEQQEVRNLISILLSPLCCLPLDFPTCQCPCRLSLGMKVSVHEPMACLAHVYAVLAGNRRRIELCPPKLFPPPLHRHRALVELSICKYGKVSIPNNRSFLSFCFMPEFHLISNSDSGSFWHDDFGIFILKLSQGWTLAGTFRHYWLHCCRRWILILSCLYHVWVFWGFFFSDHVWSKGRAGFWEI